MCGVCYSCNTENALSWRRENKEISTERKKKDYIKNREKRLLGMKEYRDKNPEIMKSSKKRYYDKKPWEMTSYVNKRRAAKARAIPKWADMSEIKLIYKKAQERTKETGIQHHVDHIVPLQGKNVSGLHVPWNLQILSIKDNLEKSNKWNG
jgi:5-methylcytosine-specific restriction endonuclease McrA